MPSKQSLKANLVHDKVDVLLAFSIVAADNDTAVELGTFLESIQDTYDAAVEEAETNEAAEKICEALAKGVPEMLKHVLAASQAFKKGDVMNGTASVMNMCAAAAPMIGSILAAGPLLSFAGPVGMAAGAVLGMIGQLLAFFGPKQDSLIDQLDHLLRELEAKAELREIKTVHDKVHNFASTLKRSARTLTARRKSPDGKGWQPSLLQRPVTEHEHVHELIQEFDALLIEVRRFNPLEGTTITSFWQIKHWLDQAENQDNENWPEVLAIWCKSYSELMSANLTFYGIAGSADLQRRKEEIAALPAGGALNMADKNAFVALLDRIGALERAQRNQMADNNETARKFLRGIKPVAQNRGTFAVTTPNRETWLGTGRNILSEDKFAKAYEHCHNFVVTPPRDRNSNKRIPYDVWTMDYWSHGFQHSALRPGKLRMEDGEEIALAAGAPERHEYKYSSDGLLFRFLDLTAIPAAASSTQFMVYGTINQENGGAVEGWSYDAAARSFARTNFKQFYGRRLTQIRAVAEPMLIPGDPDRTGAAKELVEKGPIIYAAVKDEPRIFVIAANETIVGTIPIPMAVYSGVAVEAGYVWMYGAHGFACATHASVMRCLLGERPMPWWLGNGQPKNIQGTRDMSPCEDGTLLVSGPEKLVMSNYRVDLTTPGIGEGERVIIEEWKPLNNGHGATRVQKLPIFGAPLLLSLMKDLAPPKPSAPELRRAS